MIDYKKTIMALHEKFPNLSVDDLMDILDCIKENELYVSPDISPYIKQPSDNGYPWNRNIVYCSDTSVNNH